MDDTVSIQTNHQNRIFWTTRDGGGDASTSKRKADFLTECHNKKYESVNHFDKCGSCRNWIEKTHGLKENWWPWFDNHVKHNAINGRLEQNKQNIVGDRIGKFVELQAQ